MRRILLACVALAGAASLALAASPEVDKAIKTIQGVTADPAKMQLFCALDAATDDDAEKAAPAKEQEVDDILGKLGADFEAAWEIAEGLDDKSADAAEFATAIEALAAKCG